MALTTNRRRRGRPRVALIACATALWGCSGGGCGASGGSPKARPSAEPIGPATAEITPALAKQLAKALAAKGPQYVPRTKHRSADGKPKYTNRLIRETSPYLLQHAHNPVNWFPWGDEAFALAKALRRPVFLSVGYSTCHWCHVMEEESFEDEEIAKYINDHYIPIKVDREERPDVDSLYMTAVQMLTRRGGWPMSVWLTPAREPFFGGTYFPARDGDRGSRKGFLTIMKEQRTRFDEDPSTVAENASQLTERIRTALSATSSGGGVSVEVLANATRVAKQRYDATWGGARGAPKFPSSFPVRVLLRQAQRTGDRDAEKMAITTLQKMAAGGMYDHVGGGFHRYSVDERWLVPHFEKMLYDNGLLVLAYLEGYQTTGDGNLARVARETLDYVMREMTAPSGGFYSATDADSLTPSGHREEGYFFTWTPAELRAALGPERARVVEAYYAVTPGGNFERRNILNTPKSREEIARSLGISVDALSSTVAESIPILRKTRERRPPPLRDEKIQTSWNGLMISAFAKAALLLADPRYRSAATRASDFVLRELRPEERLRHSHLEGRASQAAFLEDYTFFVAGLLDLFEATSDPRWLKHAVALMDELEAHYADTANGGYFLTADDAEKLFAREKPDYDKAIPNGNSFALMNHLRLAELTTDDKWRQRAETTIRAFGDDLARRPSALDEMMLAVDFMLGTAKEIAIVLPDGGTPSEAESLMNVFRMTFIPNRVFVTGTEAQLDGALARSVPWASGKPAREGRATAYVCERGACELPTSDPKVFAEQLAPTRP